MSVGLALPAFAADPPAIETAGGNQTTAVNLNAAARTFKVTVPTAANFYVDEDGVVTAPDPTVVTNLSSGPVIIKRVVTTATDPWHFIAGAYNADLTLSEMDSNEYTFGLDVGAWEMEDTASGNMPVLVDVMRDGDPESAVAVPAANTAQAKIGSASSGANTAPVSMDARFAPVSTKVENQKVAGIEMTIDWFTDAHPFQQLLSFTQKIQNIIAPATSTAWFLLGMNTSGLKQYRSISKTIPVDEMSNVLRAMDESDGSGRSYWVEVNKALDCGVLTPESDIVIEYEVNGETVRYTEHPELSFEQQIRKIIAPATSTAWFRLDGIDAFNDAQDALDAASENTDELTRFTTEDNGLEFWMEVNKALEYGFLTSESNIVLEYEVNGETVRYENYTESEADNYKFRVYEDHVEVIGLSADGKNEQSITTAIPHTVEGKPVTAITANAFEDCSNLALTELPAGVTDIGRCAFQSCPNLALTELPSGLKNIGDAAFWGCTNLALTELPTGLTSVKKDTFANCSSMALTTLPSGLTSIGENAFMGCSSMTIDMLPASLSSVGASAFSWTGITKLPDGVAPFMGVKMLFYHCTSMTEADIPAGVATIGENFFSGCTNLTQVTIPSSVTNIGKYAFSDCSMTSIELPPNLTVVDEYTFFGCEKLANVQMSENVTEFKHGAFNECELLDLDHLPSSLTTIGQSAFRNCHKLSLTELPSGVTSIGGGAFEMCSRTNITTVPCSYPTGAFEGTMCESPAVVTP